MDTNLWEKYEQSTKDDIRDFSNNYKDFLSNCGILIFA